MEERDSAQEVWGERGALAKQPWWWGRDQLYQPPCHFGGPTGIPCSVPISLQEEAWVSEGSRIGKDLLYPVVEAGFHKAPLPLIKFWEPGLECFVLCCVALQSFSESIQEYLANLDQAPDPTVRRDAFSSEIFSAYEVLFTSWLQSREAKVGPGSRDEAKAWRDLLDLKNVCQMWLLCVSSSSLYS